MSVIKEIRAREILDSRGNPTVMAKIILSNGVVGEATVPSGASVGSHEAIELRDGDSTRYGGLGVLSAIKNIHGPIAKKIVGKRISLQQELDRVMIDLDGTPNKKKLGTNAILAVSLACARAGANDKKTSLYRYIRSTYKLPFTTYQMPHIAMNILNGGKHANNTLSMQEFMVLPMHKRCAERIRMGSEIYHVLRDILKKKGFSVGVGDEGGFSPILSNNEEALKLIMQAIKESGYQAGHDVQLAIDAASTEWFNSTTQQYEPSNTNKKCSTADVIAFLKKWRKKYPLVSIEDGLAEDDWDGWQQLTKQLGNSTMLVGDDLFVTNRERLRQGIDKQAANAILIKLNQIGSLTETIECIREAQHADYKIVISHRSGETADTTIADLSVAVNADFIKAGAPCRSERTIKYNRLMEIEAELLYA